MKRGFPLGLLLALLFTMSAFVLTSVEVSEAQAQTKTKTKKKTTKKKKKKKKKVSKTIIGGKVGLGLIGSYTSDIGAASVEETMPVGLNLFGAYTVTPGLRLGLSTWYLPSIGYRNTGSGAPPEGSEFALNLYGEYAQKFGPVNGYLAGEGGYVVFTPGVPEGSNVTVDSATGFDLSLGAGARFPVSSGMALRAEARFQLNILTLPSTTAGQADQSISGQRLMVNVGVDFGL